MKKNLLIIACLLIAGCTQRSSQNVTYYRAVNAESGETEKIRHRGQNVADSPFNNLEPVNVDWLGNITADTNNSHKYIILEKLP